MDAPRNFLHWMLAAGISALFLAGPARADITVGAVPPDELGLEGRTPVRLSDNAGKVRVITFWASWCPPCRRELPVLAQIQAQVGTGDLQIYAVNYKEDRRIYRQLSGKLKDLSEMVFLHDTKGYLGEQYGLTGLPLMIIIGRDGKVAHVHRGYTDSVIDTVVAELNTLLRTG